MHIRYNDKLTENMPILPQLESVGSSFKIYRNGLTTLNGFNSLLNIGENFEIENNDRLKEMAGFQQLETIENDFEIYSNDSLRTIEGLTSLSSLKNGVFVFIEVDSHNFT